MGRMLRISDRYLADVMAVTIQDGESPGWRYEVWNRLECNEKRNKIFLLCMPVSS